MRAVIYCRVSTTEQAQNLSLPTQEKACREYCQRQGYDVAEVFIDAGESAKTTNRPEFLRLLAACRKQRGRLHAVVVYSLTRFSRNTADHHAIVTLLRGLGIALRSVTEPIDDSPSGRLMEGILAAMAQFDNDVRSERVTAGMRAAMERGRWVFRAPIGYLRGRPGEASLVPDPERAPAVREAFELAARGVLGRPLMDRLAELGLTTTAGRPLSNDAMHWMLRNPVYAGLVRADGWGRHRGDFEALVSEEIFARTQAQLSRPSRPARARVQHTYHPDFPLRRFVTCAVCERPMTGSSSKGRSKRYGFYHCKEGRCQAVPRERMEEAFLELLEQLRPNPGFWAVLKAAVLDTWRDAKKRAGDVHAGAQRRVSDLEAKIAKLEDAFIYRQALDDATYHARRDELREQIALARLEATEAAGDELDVEGMLAFAEHALHHAAALWTSAGSIEERIRVQWTFFPTGLRWKSGKFEPPLTVLDFYELGESKRSKTDMVDLPPPSWNHIAGFLQHWQPLRAAA
jgi:site-specific DNA recombinase